jgi:hypothetical protein
LALIFVAIALDETASDDAARFTTVLVLVLDGE